MSNSKDLCKVTINWSLTKPQVKQGELKLEYKKYPLDEELYVVLLKRFETGELTGQKIKPKPKDLQVKIKRQYFENGKEIKPAFPEIPDTFHF
jgi:hypothetical protein